MMFRIAHQPSANRTRCPYRVIEQETGREVGWISQYLDYETLRRLADRTLENYAYALLRFVRWWESVHHTDAIVKEALTESTLLDYVRFQSSQEPEVTGGTINHRVATVDHALRIVMLLQGLRSQEVLDLNRDDLLLAETQVRVRGKGNKTRFLPLAPEAAQLLDHYLRLERPTTSANALFVSLKGPRAARG
jgi:site-specific recombinase XerD